MRRATRKFASDTRGAVAPTVALSLFAIIAAGGLAFDYARLATMDSELQNAADQAALAAAGQLDGEAETCERAVAAAMQMVANQTRLANDGDGIAVTIADPEVCEDDDGITFDATASIRFWQDQDKEDAATNDENANFVEVDVVPRAVYYSLTPIVGAFTSGAVGATAFASLGEAYCKTPPVMICNPQETLSNRNFDASALIGKGIKLVSVGSGTGGWAPGNFGYLDTQGGSNGAPGLREALGWTTPPGNCVAANGVDTKPGATVTVTDAINTRFDIYDGDVSCPTGGACPASINSIKDVRRPASANGNNACKLHNQGWSIPDAATAYGWGTIPSSASTPLASTVIPAAMGHPRDMCHAVPSTTTGACTTAIGNGNWDRDAYFRANYGWDTSAWQAAVGQGVTAARITTTTPTRYQVYAWEIANEGDTIGSKVILASSPTGATGNTPVAHGTPVCSPIKGYGPGTVPDEFTADRRKITVAVVNCLEEGVNGNSTGVEVKDWVEAFMVEPSLNRGSVTNTGDAYVEIIRSIGTPTEAGTVQIVHKSVPYLIE